MERPIDSSAHVLVENDERSPRTESYPCFGAEIFRQVESVEENRPEKQFTGCILSQRCILIRRQWIDLQVDGSMSGVTLESQTYFELFFEVARKVIFAGGNGFFILEFHRQRIVWLFDREKSKAVLRDSTRVILRTSTSA